MTDLPDTATIIDGRYRVIERIGSGGMADVVCAEDLQLGRRVAIKLLHRRFAEDAEFVERFRREASSAAGLQHPHVVAVYDRGTWDGTYYIAMEYLDGRSLKRLLTEEAPLQADRAIDLTLQILRAARFAHKRGIIHRDLKPHNVIVDEKGPAPHLKVTDFGIARAGASDMTQTGSIMGTAQYLSPEQAQGFPVSAPSDLYSIGIILYEMLTARVPFEGESAVTIALKQVSERPVPPSVLNPAVPPALEAVVLRALEKDPVRRFADADEFSAALEDARRGIAPAPLPASDITQTIRPTTETFAPVAVAAYRAPSVPPDAVIDVVDPPLPPLAPPPPGSGDGNARWWVAALVGLLVIGLLVGGILLLGKDKVGVPNVVGVPQAEAELTIRHKGLSTDITQKASADQPEGTVIGQDPGGGSRIAKGDVVTLVVSSGPGTARIPELAGRRRSEARKALVKLGFTVTEEHAASDTIGANRVIETRPSAASELEKGSRVILVLSSGVARVPVPDVQNLSEADARSTLAGEGFQPVVMRKEDDTVDPGTVLKQSPLPTVKAPKGSRVTLTVAKAPAEVEVPDVVGEGKLAATHDLRKAGFTVDVTIEAAGNRAQDRRVLAQDPAGGTAKKGSTVTLTVAAYDPTLDPATTGTTTTPPPTTTPGATDTPAPGA